MYFGVFIFFEDNFNIITEPKFKDDGSPTSRLELDTIIFHTFILMNLFNQINCRVVDSDEMSDMNSFRGITTHYQFLIVLGAEFAMQHFMVIMLSGDKLT